METKQFSLNFAGRPLVAEFSPIAEQANGSVLVRYGETVVFATAVMARESRPGGNFFPLVVDYEEKFYAAGRILGSRFVRRETRPSEEAILVSRIIDRTIRPLFDQRIRNDVQLIVTAFAIDEENDPDVPAIFAASLALAISDIPWSGPISGIRVIKKENAFVVNPTYAERAGAELETLFCGKNGKINMVETEAHEASETDMVGALETGLAEIEKLNAFQADIVREMGKPKRVLELPEPSPELRELFQTAFYPRLEQALYVKEKTAWVEGINALKKEWFSRVAEKLPETPPLLQDNMYENAMDEIVHRNIVDAEPGKERRPDGRALDEIRPLFAKAHITNRNHGSGLFFRGQTHILSVATLGAPGDVLLVEGMEIREKRHFMHHYNFPPFSVGETGPMRGPGRREIGHGALAGKALRALIPSKEDFPYTIRLVSETLSSNGSSSMGSVCASSIALMDAGIPIPRHIAGISMGLMMAGDGKNLKHRVLTDIQGPEDHHGDMDFKAAGTRVGLTAIQMDVKVEGVPVQILREALEQARAARFQILDVMEQVIPAPSTELSPYAPRIVTLLINPDKIRDVIGPGGKVINEIIDLTETQIDIEQDGHIFITGLKQENVAKAQELIEEITKEYEPGQRFTGKVTRIFNFGAMVEFAPKQEGLVHISELAPFRVEQVTDVVDVGDVVPVEITGIDEMGRINLSIKRLATLELKKQGGSARPHRASHEQQRPSHHNRRDQR
ncbi:MAG: polyribonucleotide nucleotidyltransferase [Parcubacteria group bacterium Gr01-1014_70]|nr:MAG: polyribonucleotide nucleotidyltransferase [Parcubacteria group bacterium Gr01-1014_70]